MDEAEINVFFFVSLPDRRRKIDFFVHHLHYTSFIHDITCIEIQHTIFVIHSRRSFDASGRDQPIVSFHDFDLIGGGVYS